jgi:hypothetical protein
LIADETDTDVLARLRRDPECPAAVLLLAEQAARKGLLTEANERAEAVTWDDAMGSPESSAPLGGAWGSDPESQVKSLSRTYYSRLGVELEKVLGVPASVQRFGEH